MYPTRPNDFPLLREAAEKLRLNDAALAFTTEKSPAFGFGLRCGFLGMLHMEITQERLEREYDLELVMAAPTVAYQVLTTGGEELLVDHPGRLPDPSAVREIREPMAEVTVVTPGDYTGAVMTLLAESRATQRRTEYAGAQTALYYDMPLAEILHGFFDRLKSASRGYASMDYEFKNFPPRGGVASGYFNQRRARRRAVVDGRLRRGAGARAAAGAKNQGRDTASDV